MFSNWRFLMGDSSRAIFSLIMKTPTPEEEWKKEETFCYQSGYRPKKCSEIQLCNAMDYSLLDLSVHGTSQARIPAAVPFSRGSSWPRDQTCISCIGKWIPYQWTTREVPEHPYFILRRKELVGVFPQSSKILWFWRFFYSISICSVSTMCQALFCALWDTL